MKFDELSTAQLLTQMKQMEFEHQRIKDKMLSLYDELEGVELLYNNLLLELQKRVKPNG